MNGSGVVDYLTGNGQRDFRNEEYTQDVLAFSLNGEPFSSWAGPVSVAFGAEHRKDEVSGVNDPFSQASDWYIGNYKVFAASNKVTEGFLETVVPLAKDEVWAKSFDFNGAVRFTDYQTSGSVTTWKAGLTFYAGLRHHVPRHAVARHSRAQPAGAVQRGAGGFPGIINPFRGKVSRSSPRHPLSVIRTWFPEESDYTGIGVVLMPRWAPGFSASVDYWSLDIDKAIGTHHGPADARPVRFGQCGDL